MKSVLIGLAFGVLLASAPTQHANAQAASGPPEWMKQSYPAAALKPAFEEYQVVFGKGALDEKTKQLIGIAVAAQIPCEYCVYGHTAAAKHLGATEAEIQEAIAAASLTRKWSTVSNGVALDFAKFKQGVDASYAGH